MAEVIRRNSPFSPFSVTFDAEILPSLYRRGIASAVYWSQSNE